MYSAVDYNCGMIGITCNSTTTRTSSLRGMGDSKMEAPGEGNSGEERRNEDGPSAPNRQDHCLPSGDALTLGYLQELALDFRDRLSNVLKSLNRLDDKNKQSKIESLWKDLHELQKKLKDNFNTAIATDASQRETINSLNEQLCRKFPNTLKKLSCGEGLHSRDKEAIKTLQRRERSREAVIAKKDAQMEKKKRYIAELEQASFDGTLDWKIPNFSSKRQDGAVVDSPFIFTRHGGGYKMGLRMYLNGDGTGEGTHVSLHLLMMRGEFDAILDWDSDFRPTITVEVVATRGGENVVKDLPVPSSGFQKPTSDMYVAIECPYFLPLTDLDNRDNGFLQDDEMRVKFVVRLG